MASHRTDRLNSLLKEVISDVIRKDVRNPHVNELLTITRVEITKDLHYAKVYVSVIGSETEKQETLGALNSAAGFIAVNASKKVVMRYFPALTFKLDDSVDKHMKIESLLDKIAAERQLRDNPKTDQTPPASSVNRSLSKFALNEKINHFCADFLKNFENMYAYMVDKFFKKDTKKGNFWQSNGISKGV